jgi:protein TonB
LKLFELEEVEALFPAAATAKGIKVGHGVAACVVAADGRLQDCTPDPADPEGFGFSQAAVTLASHARMNPWTTTGGPVNGARIRIPIRFQASEGSP